MHTPGYEGVWKCGMRGYICFPPFRPQYKVLPLPGAISSSSTGVMTVLCASSSASASLIWENCHSRTKPSEPPDRMRFEARSCMSTVTAPSWQGRFWGRCRDTCTGGVGGAPSWRGTAKRDLHRGRGGPVGAVQRHPRRERGWRAGVGSTERSALGAAHQHFASLALLAPPHTLLPFTP